MIIFSSNKNNQIIVMTKNRSVAELSNIGDTITTSVTTGLKKPVYYFHRIKVLPKYEGTGEGKEIMIEVCKQADKLGATILNELNPYGKRDINSLKKFFKASGFEELYPEVMIRKPNTR